jgi:hypothetical protein
MITKLLIKLGLLKRNRLAFLSGPDIVSVKARVASPNKSESPMTGMRAALIEIVVGERRLEENPSSDSREKIEVFRPLGSMVIPKTLLLETQDGLIEVPTSEVKLEFPGVQNLSVTNVDRPLPKELDHVMEMLSESAACYREHTLSEGDPVTLTGMVGPRSGKKISDREVAWIARPDLGKVTVRDESMVSF